MSTDSKSFGGQGRGTKKCKTENKPYGGFPYSITVDMPPLTAVYMQFKPAAKVKAKVISKTVKN